MRHVAKAQTLHVLISDLCYQLRPQWLPRKIFALAPTALGTRNPLAVASARPLLPRMIRQRITAIRGQEMHQLLPLPRAETGAHTDVLQRARIVVET